MRKLVGLGLLASLAVLFSACGEWVFVLTPIDLHVLYYPQNPSLCPGGAGAVSTNNPGFYSLPLKPTTSPPTPPGPGEIIPFPTPSYGPVTLLPFYTSDRPEKYDLTFYCNAGEGRHLTTPAPAGRHGTTSSTIRRPPSSWWWRTAASPGTCAGTGRTDE